MMITITIAFKKQVFSVKLTSKLNIYKRIHADYFWSRFVLRSKLTCNGILQHSADVDSSFSLVRIAVLTCSTLANVGKSIVDVTCTPMDVSMWPILLYWSVHALVGLHSSCCVSFPWVCLFPLDCLWSDFDTFSKDRHASKAFSGAVRIVEGHLPNRSDTRGVPTPSVARAQDKHFPLHPRSRASLRYPTMNSGTNVLAACLSFAWIRQLK